jgi:Protein of unknown function (DUF1566)
MAAPRHAPTNRPESLALRKMNMSFRLSCLAVALATSAYSATNAVPGYDAFIKEGDALLQAGYTGQALNSGEAAIGLSADRWEGYALAARALMTLKRYEDAADAVSKAIDRAPKSKQAELRDLRRQYLLAESGISAPVAHSNPPATADQAQTPAPTQVQTQAQAQVQTQAKVPLENERKRLVDKLTWTDPATGLMWARYSRPSEYAHASFTRASEYCVASRSLGYTDWRLPTVVEFMQVYHFAPDSATVRFDGGLATNQEILPYLGFWTSTPGDREGEHVLMFEGKSVSSRNDDGAGRVGGWLAGHPWNGAVVCVRDNIMRDNNTVNTAEHP